MSEHYTQLLRDTAVILGVDPEGLSRVEACTVDDMQINMLYRGERPDDTVAVFVLLAPPAPLIKERVLETMAKANALWCGTDGCTVGLQAESGDIIIACEQPLGWLTTQRFLAMMKRVSITAALWQSVIGGAQPLEAIATDAVESRFRPDLMA